MPNQTPFMPFSSPSFGLGLQSPQSFPGYGSSPYGNWGGKYVLRLSLLLMLCSYFGQQWGPAGSSAGGLGRPAATPSPGLEPPNLVPAAPTPTSTPTATATTVPSQQTPELEKSLPDDIFDALEPSKSRSKDQEKPTTRQHPAGNRGEGRHPSQAKRPYANDEEKQTSTSNRGRGNAPQWKERNSTNTSTIPTSGEGKASRDDTQVRRGVNTSGSTQSRGESRGGRGGARGKGRGGVPRNISSNTGIKSATVSTRRNYSDTKDIGRGRGGRTVPSVPSTLFDLEGSTAAFDKESVFQDISETRTQPEEEEDDGK